MQSVTWSVSCYPLGQEPFLQRARRIDEEEDRPASTVGPPRLGIDRNGMERGIHPASVSTGTRTPQAARIALAP